MEKINEALNNMAKQGVRRLGLFVQAQAVCEFVVSIATSVQFVIEVI